MGKGEDIQETRDDAPPGRISKSGRVVEPAVSDMWVGLNGGQCAKLFYLTQTL